MQQEAPPALGEEAPPSVWLRTLRRVSRMYADARRARPLLWEALRYATIVFIAVRVATLVLALVASGLLPLLAYVDAPDRPMARVGGWDTWLTAWERGDALFLLGIADAGYRSDNGSAAFFPLYPMVVRTVGAALRDNSLVVSGLLVSGVCFLAALVVIYVLTAEEFNDPAMARRTTLYVAIFPYALFFHAPYTEALFLLLSALVLRAVRRGQWLLAGSIGALAALTRSVGVLLAVVVLVGGFAAVRKAGSWRALGSALLAALLIVAGTAMYFGYWQLRFADALKPIEVQEAWGRAARPPWMTIGTAVVEAGESPGVFPGGYAQLSLLLFAGAVAGLIWLARRVAAVYTVYVLLALLLPLSTPSTQLALLSLPRFISVLFPLFWPLARLAGRHHAHEAIVAISAAGLGICLQLWMAAYYIQ